MRTVVVAILVLSACATKPIIYQTNSIIRVDVAYSALVEAKKTFDVWDKDHQHRITWTGNGPNKETERNLDEYMRKRSPVLVAFQAAYAAVATAAAYPDQTNLRLMGQSLKLVYEYLSNSYWVEHD